MNVEDESNDKKPASNELCRLCANTDKQLIPIFQGEGIEHNIAEQIKKYLPIITVTKVDKLPLQICYQCTSTLIAWHNFFEQCRLADDRLREILSVNDKFNQVDESYHDYTDDFHDDFEDQVTTVSDNELVETVLTESTVNNSQPMETSDNDHVNSSKDVSKSITENLNDSRCLRTTNEPIDEKDVYANMLGTRSGRVRSSRPSAGAMRHLRQVEDAVIAPTDNEMEEHKCPFSICPCIWSNNNDCSHCARYNKFACGYCPMVFLKAQLRNRHLRKSHQDRLFDYCFDWLYENSLKSNADEAPFEETEEMSTFQCHECAVTLFDKSTLIHHLRDHERKKQIGINLNAFFCDHCSVASATKGALITHLWSTHSDNFGNSIEYHVEPALAAPGDRNTDYYTCDVCGHIFLKFHAFTRHLNLHSTDRYACSKCKKSFTNETALSTHDIRRHKELPKNMFVLNGRKYLKCDQCSFTCRNERNKFEEHLRVHTGEKPFTCETCGKQFRTRSLLGVHQRFVHDGVKEFPCDICGRCFSNRRYMEEHRRIHTGEKPLICDLCGKSFRQSSSLMKHLEHHMGIKRHACHLCSKRFSNTHHLKIHIKRHMGVATHVCAQCGKAFVDQYQLKNHYVVHSEARPHVCKQCGAGFKLRKHLKQHGRTHRFVS